MKSSEERLTEKPSAAGDPAAGWADLSWVQSQQQDWAAAAQSYRRAIELCPTRAHLHFNLGVVLDRQGQHEAAVASYQQAIALQPQYAEAYSNLGCVLVKQDRIAAAIQVYQQALAFQPQWATLHNNLGQAWLAHGDLGKAIECYQRAVQLQPEMALAHRNLGIALQQQQQYEAAVACFQRAIGLHQRPASQCLSDCAALYGDCGNALLAQGKWQQAMRCFQQAIAHYASRIAAYCVRSDELTDTDSLSQARIACSRFLQALQHHPTAGETSHLLSQTCLHLGDAVMAYGNLQQAEAYYQKALQLQPQALELYLRLGNCLQQQRRSNAAILVYRLALAYHPAAPQIHFQLGAMLEQQQQFAVAIDYYQQAWAAQQSGVSNSGFECQMPALPPASLPHPSLKGCSTTRDWLRAAGLIEAKAGLIEAKQPCWGNRHYISLSQPLPLDPPQPQPSARDCAGLNCAPCLKRILRQFHLSHAAVGVRVAGRQPLDAPVPLFVSVIPQGRAWAVPQQSWWQECRSIAVLTPDGFLLTDVSRDYPGQLPGCQGYDPKQHRVFSASLPPIEQIAGSIAVLSGLSGHVYFHWMVDILPRFELLRQSGIDLAALDGFWVNSIQQPFQQETLQTLGIPLDKILQSDRHPHLQADRLVVPSFAGHLGWLQPWALRFLRQTFLPAAAGAYPDRIYITRSRARYRRVLNEAEVIDRLHEFGFVCVALEDWSVAAQVALFAHAQVIVAPHGSGLTNIAFCQPETIVIELVAPSYIGHYYWVISQQLTLRHYYLAGDAFDCDSIRQLMYQNPLTEDIWINPQSLVTLLKAALVEP